MRRHPRLAAVVGGLVLLYASVITHAQTVQPVTRVVSFAPGSIEGVVQDDRGAPIAGAMVSALGATPAFATTDRVGRFELRTLSPGPYLVRANLSGYVASRGQIIELSSIGRASS